MKLAARLRDKVDRPEAFQQEHRAFAQVCRDEVEKIRRASEKGQWKPVMEKYGKFKYTAKHAHGAGCLKSLEEALSYWARVDDQFASRSRLPDFESVRTKYLFGNGFSEETGSEKDRSKPTATRP